MAALIQFHNNPPVFQSEEKEKENSIPCPLSGSLGAKERSIVLVAAEKVGVASALQKTFDKFQIPLQTKIDSELLWPRDCHVVLPDGSHLIPAFFEEENPQQMRFFSSLLPRQLLHFYRESLGFIGNGCSIDSQKRAIEVALEHSIPYKEASVCLEGGNCRIFTGVDGKPKAIVGYTSVLLSLISLYNQGFFTSYLDQKQDIDPLELPPSDDLLRIAKNVHYTLNGDICPIDRPAPLHLQPRLIKVSHQVQKMLALTKEKIGEELNIPLERIAFIFQQQFHTDLEIFVGPKDLVFVNDHRQTLQLQNLIGARQMPFLKRTIEYTEKHLLASREILAINERILSQIGCKMIRVPGALFASYQSGELFSTKEILTHWMDADFDPARFSNDPKAFSLKKSRTFSVLNFMNGVFIAHPKPHFITSGVPEHPHAEPFIKAFCKKVQEACHSMRISFIVENVPKSLIKRDGGLNCLISQIN